MLLQKHQLSGNGRLPVNNTKYFLFMLDTFILKKKKKHKHSLRQYDSKGAGQGNNMFHRTRTLSSCPSLKEGAGDVCFLGLFFLKLFVNCVTFVFSLSLDGGISCGLLGRQLEASAAQPGGITAPPGPIPTLPGPPAPLHPSAPAASPLPGARPLPGKAPCSPLAGVGRWAPARGGGGRAGSLEPVSERVPAPPRWDRTGGGARRRPEPPRSRHGRAPAHRGRPVPPGRRGWGGQCLRTSSAAPEVSRCAPF